MNKESTFIRDYRDDDFITVLEMESSRGGDTYSHAVYIRQMAVLFPKTFLVAEKKDGGIVGYVLGGQLTGESRSGLVMKIFVSPSFRRSGIGHLLMKALMTEFSISGVRSVNLTVSPSNEAALRFYENLGFLSSSYMSDYFGEGEDRIIMTAPVHKKSV